MDSHMKVNITGSAVKALATSNPVTQPAGPAWLGRMMGEDELIVMQLRPSRWLIPLESLPLLGLLVILGLVLNAAMWLMNTIGVDPVMTSSSIWFAAAWVAILTVLWQCLQWRFRIYVLTSHRVITATGVIRRSIYETSLQHVRQTLVSVSVLERCTGIGSLLIATAGTGRYDTAWFMIADPVSAQTAVQHQILQRT